MRKRGKHKKCLNECYGGGTYQEEKTECQFCHAPYDKKSFLIWEKEGKNKIQFPILVDQEEKEEKKRRFLGGIFMSTKKVTNTTTKCVIGDEPDSTTTATAPAAANTKKERGILMKNLFTPIVLVILGIVGLIFSLIAFPIFMGWIAIFCVIGAALVILGSIIWILSTILKQFKGRGLSYGLIGTGFAAFVIPILIVGCILLASSFIPKNIVPITAPTIAGTAAPTGTVANPTITVPAATIVAANPGLDQPSKSWFLAKAGTLVSGDICIFDNDNNSKKTPVYDSKESTADVVYVTSDVYIWAEWGCHVIENANAQDVANIINDKLTSGNFKSVRFFNGYTKLGTNTPTAISSKVDAASITLTAISK